MKLGHSLGMDNLNFTFLQYFLLNTSVIILKTKC